MSCLGRSPRSIFFVLCTSWMTIYLRTTSDSFSMRAIHCTVVLTVAVLLARLGSGVSAMVAAFSVITVPEGAVTFTVSRTVQVVLGAMLAFSWQTICPVPRYG